VTSDRTEKPFWDHVEELKKRLVAVLFTLLLGFVVALFFYEPVIHLLTLSKKSQSPFYVEELLREKVVNREEAESFFTLPVNGRLVAHGEGVRQGDKDTFLLPKKGWLEVERSVPKERLYLLSPLEGFKTLFKTSFFLSVLITSPILLFFLLPFFLPALSCREKTLLKPFLIISYAALVGAFFSAFYFTIPLANTFFSTFNDAFGKEAISLSSYLDFTLFLVLSNGIFFELVGLFFLLINRGFLDEALLRSKRRYAILSIFIVSAILTPPDVLSQLIMAVPLLLIYEGAILYAKTKNKTKLLVECIYPS